MTAKKVDESIMYEDGFFKGQKDKAYITGPMNDPDLVNRLYKAKVKEFNAKNANEENELSL